MTKEELDAIRARCEAATPGPWKINKHTLDCGYGFISGLGRDICQVYNITNYEVFKGNLDFIAHARQDIPVLLNALDVVKKMCPKGGNDGYITPRPCQCEMESLEAERDRLQAKNEALKRFIKRSLGYCPTCKYHNKNECTGPPIYCKLGSAWSFDEARFAGGGENE